MKTGLGPKKDIFIFGYVSNKHLGLVAIGRQTFFMKTFLYGKKSKNPLIPTRKWCVRSISSSKSVFTF